MLKGGWLMKSIILFDVDGTITDFEKIDNKAILKCFSASKFVMTVDKLLWKINKLDIIANNFPLFKFRIFAYSLASFSNYKKNMKRYEKVYVEETSKEMANYLKKHHDNLNALDTEVCFLSNNQLDNSASLYIVSVKDKRKYVRDNIYGKYDIVYVVGNNWSDDVKLGLRLRKLTNLTQPVYIGKSKFLINFLLKKKPVEVYGSLDEFISHLLSKKG